MHKIKKTGIRTSTLKMELMHGAEKQGVMHQFTAERTASMDTLALSADISEEPRGREKGKAGPAERYKNNL